jgi:BON domain
LRHLGEGCGHDRGRARASKSKVCDRLAAELPGEAEQVQVDVKRGEVTLAGTVDTSEARRRAENVAGSIAGVVSVKNNCAYAGRAARARPMTGAPVRHGRTRAGPTNEGEGNGGDVLWRAKSADRSHLRHTMS